MRYLAVLAAISTFAVLPLRAEPLNLVIVQGDGAINNIRQRTARETIVRVEDENHKPVAGATVVFTLPTQGAGGTFAGGTQTLAVTTSKTGLAVAHGFHPNAIQGSFQMHVNASFAGHTATATVTQSNGLTAAAGASGSSAAGAGAGGGATGTATAGIISIKLIAIIAAVAGAAAAGGAVAATRGGGGGTNTALISPTITPATGTVGPPK